MRVKKKGSVIQQMNSYPSLSSSVVLLNGLDEEVYLNVKISTQSQLLYTEGNSHYNEYQKFLYELCSSLHKKMGYRKISQYLNKKGYKYQKLTDEELPEKIADLIAEQKVIGWFQGRMEFGPRALGSRTIIGDARSPETQKTINLKIKYRESFRPFGPSVRSENISDYFDIDRESPYMLLVADVNKNKQLPMTKEENSYFGLKKLNIVRSEIPAVTHVDYSARIQSVNKKTNPRYHEMLTQFNEKFGCAVVVNTSFNVRGEPIVCSPTDAFKCFMGTELEVLAIGNYLLIKEEQDESLKENYEERYELD